MSNTLKLYTCHTFVIFEHNSMMMPFCMLQIFPAVLKALKSKVARLAMVDELKYYVQNNKSTLEHQQFDLVVRLLNCALQVNSALSVLWCHLHII